MHEWHSVVLASFYLLSLGIDPMPENLIPQISTNFKLLHAHVYHNVNRLALCRIWCQQIWSVSHVGNSPKMNLRHVDKEKTCSFQKLKTPSSCQYDISLKSYIKWFTWKNNKIQKELQTILMYLEINIPDIQLIQALIHPLFQTYAWLYSFCYTDHADYKKTKKQ